MAKNRTGIWSRPIQATREEAPIDCQEVARVAYALYERRGREDGHDLEDWLKAEEILKRRKGGQDGKG